VHYVWQDGHGKNSFTGDETFGRGDYLGNGLQVI
jgi:hypothetical protein